jgi:hypothetical protein
MLAFDLRVELVDKLQKLKEEQKLSQIGTPLLDKNRRLNEIQIKLVDSF